ncbi:MAG: C45 family autoproteolytic acyltransferase/hydrolase [Promethearchaeota archaeon]
MTSIWLPSKKEIPKLLRGSYRTDVNGWIRLHLSGDYQQMGFQHGYWLAQEIQANVKQTGVFLDKAEKYPWKKFRADSEKICWHMTPKKLQDEIQAVEAGMRLRGIKGISWKDILAINAYGDTLSRHYAKEHERNRDTRRKSGHCSAFIATGNATEDRRIVLCHNTWFSYIIGTTYNIMMSLAPTEGHRMFIHTWPGAVGGSTIDWDMNDSGIMCAETTITGASKFKEEEIPYFVRGRLAIQFADSIDKWMKTMIEGNNGGWANAYLVGDTKTNEIGWLELGIFEHAARRTKSGYFVGSNWALDENVRKECKGISFNEKATHSCASRTQRLLQLMEQHNGQINVEIAQQIISDHFDVSLGKEQPSANTICGHTEYDKRGLKEWKCGPFEAFGATDAKVVTSALSEAGSWWAHWGPACNLQFNSKKFFSAHPEYAWQAPYTHDIIPHPWTLFKADSEWGK